MVAESSYRDAVEDLHEFFVAWYDGSAGPDAFDRLDDALAPDFEMIAPDGTRHDRPAVVRMVRESFDRDDPDAFDIEIRNVELVREMGAHAAVRYEEWQTRGGTETGRISTALLRADESAPAGFAWLDLHETWIEEG
jgi:hypothetical protein